MVYLHIVLFLICQIAANLLFKWGTSAPNLYWYGFIFGNMVGMTSILFMMGMYQHLPVANVVAIGTGGTFLLNQIVMFIVFREKIHPAAMAGIALIFAGILLVAFFNSPKAENKQKTEQMTIAEKENVL